MRLCSALTSPLGAFGATTSTQLAMMDLSTGATTLVSTLVGAATLVATTLVGATSPMHAATTLVMQTRLPGTSELIGMGPKTQPFQIRTRSGLHG